MGKQTRKVHVRDLMIGGGAPISVQSMCATQTSNIKATLEQVSLLQSVGADLIRIAVDTDRDVESLKEIRKSTQAHLVVDLQENYRLAEKVAPHVDKMRYNPGHLHHLNKEVSIEKKVEWLVKIAKENDNAIRIGVNCGSIAPQFLERYPHDHVKAIVESALAHCEIMDKIKFFNYVVSLKDSNPLKVVQINEEFSRIRPDVPIHLGVTEAGLPPEGVIKTRMAFEKLIPKGIGDTIRVSLTLPFEKKYEEVTIGRQILKDIENKNFISFEGIGMGINIISCPSCSRVQNADFVELAQKVKEMTLYAKQYPLTIAVMGCRVNGPGETDEADLGLWCGPKSVTLKQKSREIGTFSYDAILNKLREELDKLIELEKRKNKK